MIKKIGIGVSIDILISSIVYGIAFQTQNLWSVQGRILTHIRQCVVIIIIIPALITLRNTQKKRIIIIIWSIGIYSVGDIILREYIGFSVGQYHILYMSLLSILACIYIHHRIRFIIAASTTILIIGITMTKLLPWYEDIVASKTIIHTTNDQNIYTKTTPNWTTFLLNPTINTIMGGYIRILTTLQPTIYQQALKNYREIQTEIITTWVHTPNTNILQNLREQTKKGIQSTSWYQKQ